MQSAAYWIYLGLMILFIFVFVIWRKRNMGLLSEAERGKFSDAMAQARRSELRYIWIFIVLLVGFLLLQKLFGIPSVIFGLIVPVTLIFGILRNIWFYRKENLPSRFIKSELWLGVITCSFMAAMTVWAYWQ